MNRLHSVCLRIVLASFAVILLGGAFPLKDSAKVIMLPNEKVATEVAKLLLEQCYGESVRRFYPLQARLTNKGIWVVRGTLPESMLGGVPEIQIRKRDCRVVRISHGK